MKTTHHACMVVLLTIPFVAGCTREPTSTASTASTITSPSQNYRLALSNEGFQVVALKNGAARILGFGIARADSVMVNMPATGNHMATC